MQDVNDLKNINFNAEDYVELFEAYKADLQDYIANVSAADKGYRNYLQSYLLNLLEDKWVPLLGFSKTKILQDISDLQTPKTDYVTSLSLKTALDYAKTSSGWVVPSLLKNAALYLLAGEPKAGKSLLIYFLIHSIAVSGSFLGRPTRTGNVLYIQLEESLETIGERLFMSGFGDQSEESSLVVNFSDRVVIERAFDATVDIDWLIKKIQEVNPVLVIIDSLRAATLNSSASENTNEFGKLVYRLQQVFNFTNTCGVIIHHMNKGSAGNGSSAISRVSGHSSIVAGTSGVIALTSEETEMGRVMCLKTLPRDGIPVTIKYQIETGDDGLWKLDKIYEDTPLSSPVTSQILRMLGSNPGYKYTYSQIANALDYRGNDRLFKEALSYLQSTRIITNKYENKVFRYWLPEDSLWLINPASIKDFLSASAIDANSLLTCNKKRDVYLLTKDWEDERQAKAVRELSPPERERLRDLVKTWEFMVGEVVLYKGRETVVLEHIDPDNPTLSNNRYKLEGVEDLVLEQDIDYLIYTIDDGLENDDSVITINANEDDDDDDLLSLAIFNGFINQDDNDED